MTSAAPSRPQQPRSRLRAVVAITAGVIVLLIIGFFVFAGLYADILWYQQLQYLGVLLTQWGATAAMFGVGFLGMGVPVWLSILIAYRARPGFVKLSSQLDRYQQVFEPLRRLAMIGIPAVLGIFVGISTASRWDTVLLFLNRTPFGGPGDPQFGLDTSFYMFELPFYRGLVAYLSAIVLIAGLAALATSYLYGGIRIAGREVRISRSARVQLAVIAALYAALQAISIWLDQYAAVLNQGTLFTGASYADVNAVIPGRVILAGAAAIVAILCIVTAAIGRWRLPLIATALLVVSSIVIGSVYPAIVQRFQVDPSAATVEAPYISRALTATRDAYGVSNVVTEQYSATTTATQGALRSDAQTTANIRILDPALVSDTFKQLQRVRQYYTFPTHLSVDRYAVNGTTQDTVIAVRELNQAGLNTNTWYNTHLVYTHGYGVVAAYGNQRASDGSPVFAQSGIPTTGVLGNYQPRIYFGQQSPAYSIVGGNTGTPVEFDYPSGNTDQGSTFTYDANGGPQLSNFLTKLVYAIKFQSSDIVFSTAVTNQSQILYNRDPASRVKKAAPYLTIDSAPYPAVVDGSVKWIVDAYTTSANYPYSKVTQLSNSIVDTYTQAPTLALDDINYIRNSVKATVDAYTGAVTLYAWDATDPVLQTWNKIYPNTLKPATDMSAQLQAHIRYPQDLFKVQRTILETYHVTDAGQFYNATDAWVTPNDPTSSAATAAAQPPYYLTMKVPGTASPGFTLYSTFIPRNQTANDSQSILTGYLTANSDYGPNYGKLTLLTLPKNDSIPGPGQVQNQFNTSTTIAEQLNVLKVGGQTKVLSGNLLTLPVGGGLLYVQPVYVQSTGETAYPLLRKVLVAFGNKVAFEDTLDLALNSLFGGNSGAAAGDTNVPATPGPAVTPGATTSPAPSATATPAPTPSTTSTPGTATTVKDPAALQAALQAYQTALAARTAAYAANDLTAAAAADQQMRNAVAAAMTASGF